MLEEILEKGMILYYIEVLNMWFIKWNYLELNK